MKTKAMLTPDDPSIAPSCQTLLALLKSHGVSQWAEDKVKSLNRDYLIYLCKFSYFTGILTKAQIARFLKLERPELKKLIKAWYDDHRSKGCGTC